MYLKLVFSLISALGAFLIAHEAGYGLEELQVWGTLPFTYLDLSHGACLNPMACRRFPSPSKTEANRTGNSVVLDNRNASHVVNVTGTPAHGDIPNTEPEPNTESDANAEPETSSSSESFPPTSDPSQYPLSFGFFGYLSRVVFSINWHKLLRHIVWTSVNIMKADYIRRLHLLSTINLRSLLPIRLLWTFQGIWDLLWYLLSALMVFVVETNVGIGRILLSWPDMEGGIFTVNYILFAFVWPLVLIFLLRWTGRLLWYISKFALRRTYRLASFGFGLYWYRNSPMQREIERLTLENARKERRIQVERAIVVILLDRLVNFQRGHDNIQDQLDKAKVEHAAELEALAQAYYKSTTEMAEDHKRTLSEMEQERDTSVHDLKKQLDIADQMAFDVRREHKAEIKRKDLEIEELRAAHATALYAHAEMVLAHIAEIDDMKGAPTALHAHAEMVLAHIAEIDDMEGAHQKTIAEMQAENEAVKISSHQTSQTYSKLLSEKDAALSSLRSDVGWLNTQYEEVVTDSEAVKAALSNTRMELDSLRSKSETASRAGEETQSIGAVLTLGGYSVTTASGEEPSYPVPAQAKVSSTSIARGAWPFNIRGLAWSWVRFSWDKPKGRKLGNPIKKGESEDEQEDEAGEDIAENGSENLNNDSPLVSWNYYVGSGRIFPSSPSPSHKPEEADQEPDAPPSDVREAADEPQGSEGEKASEAGDEGDNPVEGSSNLEEAGGDLDSLFGDADEPQGSEGEEAVERANTEGQSTAPSDGAEKIPDLVDGWDHEDDEAVLRWFDDPEILNATGEDDVKRAIAISLKENTAENLSEPVTAAGDDPDDELEERSEDEEEDNPLEWAWITAKRPSQLDALVTDRAEPRVARQPTPKQKAAAAQLRPDSPVPTEMTGCLYPAEFITDDEMITLEHLRQGRPTLPPLPDELPTKRSSPEHSPTPPSPASSDDAPPSDSRGAAVEPQSCEGAEASDAAKMDGQSTNLNGEAEKTTDQENTAEDLGAPVMAAQDDSADFSRTAVDPEETNDSETAPGVFGGISPRATVHFPPAQSSTAPFPASFPASPAPSPRYGLGDSRIRRHKRGSRGKGKKNKRSATGNEAQEAEEPQVQGGFLPGAGDEAQGKFTFEAGVESPWVGRNAQGGNEPGQGTKAQGDGQDTSSTEGAEGAGMHHEPPDNRTSAPSNVSSSYVRRDESGTTRSVPIERATNDIPWTPGMPFQGTNQSAPVQGAADEPLWAPGMPFKGTDQSAPVQGAADEPLRTFGSKYRSAPGQEPTEVLFWTPGKDGSAPVQNPGMPFSREVVRIPHKGPLEEPPWTPGMPFREGESDPAARAINTPRPKKGQGKKQAESAARQTDGEATKAEGKQGGSGDETQRENETRREGETQSGGNDQGESTNAVTDPPKEKKRRGKRGGKRGKKANI